jgi:ribonucleotide monophosphatase NagD (HAD superfamily)
MWQSDKLNMTIIIIIHNNPTTTYDDTSETSQQKMLIDIKDLDIISSQAISKGWLVKVVARVRFQKP